MRLAFLAIVLMLSVPGLSLGADTSELQDQIRRLQVILAELKKSKEISPPVPVCEFSRTLSFGSRGDDVFKLQTFLRDTGRLSDNPTGYFGANTQKALQTWQASHGIVSSGSPASTGWGVLGKRTREAIVKQCGVGSSGTYGAQVPLEFVDPNGPVKTYGNFVDCGYTFSFPSYLEQVYPRCMYAAGPALFKLPSVAQSAVAVSWNVAIPTTEVEDSFKANGFSEEQSVVTAAGLVRIWSGPSHKVIQSYPPFESALAAEDGKLPGDVLAAYLSTPEYPYGLTAFVFYSNTPASSFLSRLRALDTMKKILTSVQWDPQRLEARLLRGNTVEGGLLVDVEYTYYGTQASMYGRSILVRVPSLGRSFLVKNEEQFRTMMGISLPPGDTCSIDGKARIRIASVPIKYVDTDALDFVEVLAYQSNSSNPETCIIR